LLLAPAIGCAAAQPYQTKLDVYSLQGAPPRDLAGLSVTAELVTHQNVNRFGQLQAQAHWSEVDSTLATSHSGGSAGAPQATVERSAILSLAPLPVLAVTIKNSSHHALRFDRAEIELADGTGHTFKAVFDVGDLQGRFDADIMGARAGFPPDLREQLHSNIAQIPWVTRTTTVASGAEWTGFIAFDHPVHDADEFNHFMEKAESLSVSLRNVTLDGAPLDPIGFSFARQTVPTTLTCPGDVRPPSLVSCKAS
jgi:hypothetical protein